MVGFCLEKCGYLQNIYRCGSYTFFAWFEDNYDMNDVTHHSSFVGAFFEKLTYRITLSKIEFIGSKFGIFREFGWVCSTSSVLVVRQTCTIKRSSFYGLKILFEESWFKWVWSLSFLVWTNTIKKHSAAIICLKATTSSIHHINWVKLQIS